MVNQNNYQEDVSDFIRGASVNRIVFPYLYEGFADRIKFSEDLADDFIQLNFYGLQSGVFYGSTTITAQENYENGYVYKRITPDETDADQVVIKLAQLIEDDRINLPPGFFDVSIHFFSKEVGQLPTRPLSIKQVSPSRKELTIQYDQPLTDEERELSRREIAEFVDPSIKLIDALALLKQIFQDAAIETTTDIEDIAVDDVLQQWQEEFPNGYQTLFNAPPYQNESIIIPDLISEFLKNGNLNDKLPAVYYLMFRELLERAEAGDRRIQLNEMIDIINLAVDRAYEENAFKFPKTVEVR